MFRSYLVRSRLLWASFWVRAGYSSKSTFSFYMSFCNVCYFPFGIKDRIFVLLIEFVSGHCLLFLFLYAIRIKKILKVKSTPYLEINLFITLDMIRS